MKKIKEHIFLSTAATLFLLLTIPFINTLPYMDGNIDFVKTVDFYEGRFNQIFNNWGSIHPPFKLFLIYPFYALLGINSFSFSLGGVILGVLGIIAFYLLTLHLFDKKTASLATLLLAGYPLIVSNSIFMTIDYLLTNLIIISIYFYIKKKYFLYFVLTSFAVLTKETGLIFPTVLLMIEILSFLKNRKMIINKNSILKTVCLFLPFSVFYLWKTFLDLNNKSSWSDWIFTDTQNHGAFYTIFNNIITLNFFNPWAIAHWKQLFFLNFNWVYFLIILLGIIYVIFFKKHKFNFKNNKIIIAFFMFFITYSLSVLTFQTYTIPRYALPVIPFLIIGAAWSTNVYKNKHIKIFTAVILLTILLTSLFTSKDPIALRIWGETQIFNQKLYSLNDHLAGNDGITYNIQYLLITKERSEMIKNSKGNELISGYCRWIFPDPNNEVKMLKKLNLNPSLYCIQIR